MRTTFLILKIIKQKGEYIMETLTSIIMEQQAIISQRAEKMTFKQILISISIQLINLMQFHFFPNYYLAHNPKPLSNLSKIHQHKTMKIIIIMHKF